MAPGAQYLIVSFISLLGRFSSADYSLERLCFDQIHTRRIRKSTKPIKKRRGRKNCKESENGKRFTLQGNEEKQDDASKDVVGTDTAKAPGAAIAKAHE